MIRAVEQSHIDTGSVYKKAEKSCVLDASSP